ncbi:leucine-rich repeat domain-containing protein [Pseudomonas fluorescens]|uniref:leucine-rich repeat domain-containing protein n=1 Tax=Pseudomonas fluorescens TaxID=294 RepID=UPI00177F94D1|nr:leucine-rich repeat domain-containing protein [Pseudomonas fluorescens]MBD8097393.1 leucine-rich repeat domain-containing protein [Pseudomonas fluorescens]MBD8773365.1 leucine-rich repeat domain-containing protein [Pseudomonas fluorescens]MBD8777698.1 leucine-rich repeat domain-containing protein [Pseudomonas fluorescens]MBD8794300.1 leucine-rich repeat domain-containing protein [Pseudomonas fluorescens]
MTEQLMGAGRASLNEAVQAGVPLTPSAHGAKLIRQKWGAHVDPMTAQLVTLDYDYHGHPPIDGVHQGKIRFQQSLVQALLSDYQAVADDRFGETAFGVYTPPAVGPRIKLVEHVDEFAYRGSGNHTDYEGIYRQTIPQTYGPETQIAITPAAFKKWVWALEYKDLYKDYLDGVLPSDATIKGVAPYALRTTVKTAFVMAAFLQKREGSLSLQGLQLALSSAGLGEGQIEFGFVNNAQLEHSTHPMAHVEASLLMIYRYTATDIWVFRHRTSGLIVLYVPGNSSPLHEFSSLDAMRAWVVQQGQDSVKRKALALHFAKDDRFDTTWHAGVMTALTGMTEYPRMHRLNRDAGFFNNDGYWNPADYISLDTVAGSTDPFVALVKATKQANLHAAEEAIRDDADVNRANLSAVIEPVVGWINRWGALAIFFPGGEGLLGLAGLIEAGYGLNEIDSADNHAQVSEGITRTVFGLLNALPLVVKAGLVGAVIKGEIEVTTSAVDPALTVAEGAPDPVPLPRVPVTRPAGILHPPPGTEGLALTEWTRAQLMRGFGPQVEALTDETLEQVRQVSGVSDDHLRYLHAEGLPPQGVLADTLTRFKIDRQIQTYITQLATDESIHADLHLVQWMTLDTDWPASVRMEWVKGDQAIWSSQAATEPGKVLRVDEDTTLFPELARGLDEQQTRAFLGSQLPVDQPYPDVYTRARLLRQKALGIAKERRTDLFEEHYQAAVKTDNELLLALKQQHPTLPYVVLEEMLSRQEIDPNIPLTLAQTKEVFQQLEPLAEGYEQEVRLARAYEGVFTDSVRNPDSDALLLHSVQQMPGWPTDVAIVVREGNISGPVLDRIGSANLSNQRVLIKTGEHFQVYAALQPPGYTHGDLADMILHSLTDDERGAMNVRVDQGLEHFKFKIRRNLLRRPQLSSVLHRQSLRTPFYEPEEGGLAGGSASSTITEQGTLLPRITRGHVKAYFPDSTDQQVDDFIARFDHLDDLQRELERIRQAFVEFDRTLSTWEMVNEQDVMEAFDLVDIDLAADGVDPEISKWVEEERSRRTEVGATLRRLFKWQGEGSENIYRDGKLVGLHLQLDGSPQTPFPYVHPPMDSVISLTLSGGAQSVDGILSDFRHVESLQMQMPEVRELPRALEGMTKLTHLNLSECQITLTTHNSVERLARLTQLEELDLDYNPLIVAPDVSRMTRLRWLSLSDTQLSEFPRGVTGEIPLGRLDLTGNRIQSIPTSVRLRADIELSGNPISDPDSLSRLISYRRRTGNDLWLNPQTQHLPQPSVWLADLPPAQIAGKTGLWNRLLSDSDTSLFARRFSDLPRAPEYALNRQSLQARVWKILEKITNADGVHRAHLCKLAALDPNGSAPGLLETLEHETLMYEAWRKGQPVYQLPKRARLE